MTTYLSDDDAAWILTYTGRKFWPLTPRPEDVCIEDIAHALANMCRYTGHCAQHYSVAQHAVLVSFAVPPAFALKGLMHDASEAYLPDLASPVKRHPIMAPYRAAEERIMNAIGVAIGLTRPLEPAEVKIADGRMLATEARDLLQTMHPDWSIPFEPYPDRITPWSPADAKRAFLNRYNELHHGA
jgi:5'-deoxynucleotidase YfbR-like HD superfamily hydrolase